MVAQLDAVVVGAGPNGLTAAVTLARAGLGVRVYEANDTVGGGARTAELTLPGFRHDVCSAVQPLGAGSPALAELPLADFGFEWVHPDLPLAHPLPDGSAAVLSRSVDETAQSLDGADGTRYGLQRLCDTLAQFRGRSATAVIEGLTVALGEFQIGSHADDTAALVLRRRGPRNPERDERDASEAENLAVTE